MQPTVQISARTPVDNSVIKSTSDHVNFHAINKFNCNENIASKLINREYSYHKDSEANFTAVIKKEDTFKRLIVKADELFCYKRESKEDVKPVINLQVRDKKLRCLIDSGSDRTIVKHEILREIGETNIRKSNVRVRGLTGVSHVIGETEFELRLSENINHSVEALVIDNLKFRADAIIGSDLLKRTSAKIDYGNKTVYLGTDEIPFTGSNVQKTSCLLGELTNDINERKRENKRKRAQIKTSGEITRNLKREIPKNKNTEDTVREKYRNKKKINQVHILCNTTISASSFGVHMGYSKLPIGTYIVNKNTLKNGLQIAETLIEINSKEDRNIPLAIINVSDNEIVLKESSMITTIEPISVESYTILCEDIGKEIEKNRHEHLRSKINVYDESKELKLQAGRTNVQKMACKVNNQESLTRVGYKKFEHEYVHDCTSRLDNINYHDCMTIENRPRQDETISLDDNINKISHTRKNETLNSRFDLKTIESNCDDGDKKRKDFNDKTLLPNDTLRDYDSIAPITQSDRIGDITLDEADMNNDDLKEDDKIKFCKLMNSHRKLFAKPGERAGTTNKLSYKIELKTNVPVNVPAYKTNHKIKAQMSEELRKLNEAGIISPSISQYNSPVICVKKSDGSMRICIDFRKLNQEVYFSQFTLPNITDILASLGGARLFTVLDVQSAFHQIKLNEDSKPYTAFSANGSKFHYNVLPFGLNSSPSVYQALMSRVLHNLLGSIAYCYIDDIVIFSKNIAEHFEHLEKVFSRLEEADLTLKLQKCSFFKKEITYLGYRISRDGISLKDECKIKKAPRPINVKSLQRFLGTANYFRKFIPNFALTAIPLYALLKKDNKFQWSQDCDNAFNKIKLALDNTATLAHPNYSKSFVLFTDASKSGLGACLCQEGEDGAMRPLGYFSKVLSETQRRYSTTKREGFALISGLRHFQYSLLGYMTIVCTDHKPLVSLFSTKLPQDTALARWSLAIQAFNIIVKYYPGKYNVVADYLSRLDNPLTLKEIDKSPTLAISTGCDVHDSEDFEFDNETVTLYSKTEQPLTPYIPNIEDISWNNEQLLLEQSKDDFCINIREKFTKKANDKSLVDYLYIGGILYKKRILNENNVEILNAVIPLTLLDKAITSVHYLAHGGIEHTKFKFKLKYFNIKENRHIANFVKSCDLCAILKGPLPNAIPLKQAPVPKKPFEIVSIDFLGPLKLTDKGNKHLLCIIDLFSRFCVLKPLPTKDTSGVIDTLREVFDTHGYPRVLISDNALEFTSRALLQFASIHSVHKTTVLPYSPHSNGMVERNNRKIVQLLRLFINSEPNSWDFFISTTANIINNSLNITIGDTPAFVCFGYDTAPNTCREELGTVYNYDSEESLIRAREIKAIQIRETVRNLIMDNRAKVHKYANRKKHDREIAVGDRVLFKNNIKKHKLDLLYSGPAVVTKVIDNHKLALKIGFKEYPRVHINQCIRLKGSLK